MEFRTKIDIEAAEWKITPQNKICLVGSCFADNLGKFFEDNHFRVIANPYGVMYNPASIAHTIERMLNEDKAYIPDIALFTLGTNHVYILNETNEIVDNCQKRPQHLFTEKELTTDECASYLNKAIAMLKERNPHIHIIITVSPIRYRKYGYHGSQLSKATLLLAIQQTTADYFPSYEIMNDELRDYRFYKEDMLHPTPQAVAYIFERFCDTYMSKEATTYMAEWKPIREALAHKPFNPDSTEYKTFIAKTLEKQKAFEKKYAL